MASSKKAVTPTTEFPEVPKYEESIPWILYLISNHWACKNNHGPSNEASGVHFHPSNRSDLEKRLFDSLKREGYLVDMGPMDNMRLTQKAKTLLGALK